MHWPTKYAGTVRTWMLSYLRRQKEIASLLTLLPGVTNGDGSKNVCLIQRSADGHGLILIDSNALYTAPLDSIEAIVYRVREALMREQDTGSHSNVRQP